jgi:hypothetical protein
MPLEANHSGVESVSSVARPHATTAAAVTSADDTSSFKRRGSNWSSDVILKTSGMRIRRQIHRHLQAIAVPQKELIFHLLKHI